MEIWRMISMTAFRRCIRPAEEALPAYSVEKLLYMQYALMI
jgi:hypothetical protein